MKTKIISFANEKGGCGKTTVTEMVATWFFYMTDLKVAIVDLDPQQTASIVRRGDLQGLESASPKSKKVMWYKQQTEDTELFPVISLPDSSKFETLLENELKQYDVVFLDLPGTVDTRQETILPHLDFIFVPTHVDPGTVNSSLQYTVTIIKMYAKYQEAFNLKAMRFFYSFYSLNSNQNAFPAVKNDLEEATGLKFMDNHIYSRTELESAERSTIFPIRNSEKEDHFLFKFCMELITIMSTNKPMLLPEFNNA